MWENWIFQKLKWEPWTHLKQRVSLGSLHIRIKLDSCEIHFALKLITMCDTIALFAASFPWKYLTFSTLFTLKTDLFPFLHFYTPKYLQNFTAVLSFLSETLVNNQCGASFEETKNFCNKKYYTVIKKDSLQKCSYEYDKKECGEEKKGNAQSNKGL